MFGVRFIKRGVTFFTGGFCDRLVKRLSGKKVSFGKCIAAKLNDCEPWSDHYEEIALTEIRNALHDKDYQSARGLAAFGAKTSGTTYCVEMLRSLIDFLAEGQEIEYELMAFFD